MSCRSSKKAIGRQRPAVQRVAGMFAQEPPPNFDVAGRREPGERPELLAEVGLVEVAAPLATSPQSTGPAGLIANAVAAKR